MVTVPAPVMVTAPALVIVAPVPDVTAYVIAPALVLVAVMLNEASPYVFVTLLNVMVGAVPHPVVTVAVTGVLAQLGPPQGPLFVH